MREEAWKRAKRKLFFFNLLAHFFFLNLDPPPLPLSLLLLQTHYTGARPAASRSPRSRPRSEQQEEEQVQDAAQGGPAVARGEEARQGGLGRGRAAAAGPERPEQHADPQLQPVGGGQAHADGREAGRDQEDVRGRGEEEGWRRRRRRRRTFLLFFVEKKRSHFSPST